MQTPVTNYESPTKVFLLSTELALKANMEYVHEIMDADVAIKSYHLIWNDTERWKRIIFHLGDLNSFMAFCGATGKFIVGSGFEEIVYQSNLCTSRSLNAVLSGKHYNRGWWVDENCSEALEILFIKYFLIQKYCLIQNNKRKLSMKVKREGFNGEFGSTKQFCLKYVEMVETLQQLHFALNTNSLSLKLQP